MNGHSGFCVWTITCHYSRICVAPLPCACVQVFVKAGVAYMQLGSSTVPYHRAFRLYLTTAMDNPHYLPEVSTKVTLLNFIVTPSGLTDQLLGLVVKTERPDLEEEKTKLLVTRATNQRQLREIEASILSIIAAKVRTGFAKNFIACSVLLFVCVFVYMGVEVTFC
jgi:hypothetical protein